MIGDSETLPGVKLTESNIETQKLEIGKHKAEEVNLIDEEETLEDEIEHLNSERRAGLEKMLEEIFPDFVEARDILNEGIISSLVQDSVELVKIIDLENDSILKESTVLNQLLDAVYSLE